MKDSIPNLHSFEVTKCSVELGGFHPVIVITHLKALDSKGKYIKFVNMKDALPYLHEYPIKFKKQ